MRSYMVERRVGEWLGPVDWDYDFSQHGWDNGGSTNPKCISNGMEALRMVEEDGGLWAYSSSSFSLFRVIRVGMFDGWPFWKPTPALGYIGPLGSVKIVFFYSLHKGKLMAARECDRCDGIGGRACSRMLCTGVVRR
jgi:hypothetical protein